MGCMDFGMVFPPHVEYGGVRLPCNLPSAMLEHLQFHVELIFDTAPNDAKQRAENERERMSVMLLRLAFSAHPSNHYDMTRATSGD